MWPKIKLFFHNHWSGTTKPQRFFLLSLILVLTIVPAIASANVSTFVLEIATNLISIIVYFLGRLVAVVLHCLVYVAQYNNFINEGVVREGWKVVRDICNMFFVLGLLIIAFGTVLRLPNYSGKNSLKNLIVGAVMVNFSKTICGLIIDFAQVIMLTFVNGFKDVGAGNLTQMLGLTTLFNVVAGDGNATAMDSLGVFTSYLLALVYLVIALVAILSMTIMLIQRAVMIWIYVVLSPFPYLLSALPKTGSLGSKGNQWWTEFTRLVVIGPLLAFFLWLSFFTASGTNLSSSNNKGSQLILGEGTGGLNTTEGTVIDVNAGVTESGTAQSIIKFMVSIGLLFGGMKIAQQSSSLVGSTIGNGMQRLQKLQKGATKKLTSTAATTGKFLSRNALKGGGATLTALSKNRNGTAGKTFQKIGAAASTWGGELADARKKEKVKARLKTLEKLGLGVGDNTMEKFKDVVDDEGFKKAANLGKGALIGTAVGFATANPLAGIAAGMTFGGASGIVEATGLNKKTGRTIKQFVNGTDAQKAVEDYAQNGTITAKDFYGGTRRGLTKFQEKFLGELANPNNAKSAAALANLKAQIDDLSFVPGNDKNQKTIEAMLKGIATFEKKGGNVARFQDLLASISRKNTGKNYDDIKNDVKLRQVGDAAIAGDGSKALKVNSFAAGKHRANVIGVDFNKLSSIKDSIDSPDLTAGANIAPEKMAAVSKELTGLIDGELAELGQANQDLITQPLYVLEQRINQLRSYRSNAFKSGNQNTITRAQNTTSELEQLSRARDLRQAKEKLADPSSLNNLSLKNTGIALNSTKESHTTNLYEALHGFGIDNEKLTENIAQAMAQGSYKIDDTAVVAQNIKQTISQKNITPEQVTTADINAAISGVQPASPVEQVIAKENGTTIVNNITNNNVVNNVTNKIGPTSDAAETRDETTNEAPENSNNRNGLQKNNDKLDNIKKGTLERRAFEGRRYFMDKKDNKRHNDKINKFIHDFDNKQ